MEHHFHSDQDCDIIVEGQTFQIVQFRCCGNIGFRFNNILKAFTIEDFFDFVDSYHSVEFENTTIPFPDGKTRTIMSTGRSDIQFCFTRHEFETTKRALAQASFLLKAKLLINN